MNNVICVDLTILNPEQLMLFCENHNFKYEVLLELKQKTYWKVWFFADGTGLSFNLTKNNIFKIKDYEKIRYFDDVLDCLSKIAVYEPAPIESIELVLDVDTILEKILKYGKDSITKEEKNFLDNL